MAWQKTGKDKEDGKPKWWLKRDLGEGQLSSEWHTCSKGGELGSQTEIIHKIRPFCHECHTKLIICEEPDCQLCMYAKSLCTVCDAHVSTVDMK